MRAGRLNFTFLYLVPYLLLSSSWDLVILLKSRTAASQLPWSVCVSALCSLQWADYLFVSSKGRLFFPQISFCSNIILRFELLMSSPQSRPILSWLASSTICKRLPVLHHMLSYCSICQIVLWVASSTYCYKCGPASFIFGAIINVWCKIKITKIKSSSKPFSQECSPDSLLQLALVSFLVTHWPV